MGTLAEPRVHEGGRQRRNVLLNVQINHINVPVVRDYCLAYAANSIHSLPSPKHLHNVHGRLLKLFHVIFFYPTAAPLRKKAPS